MSASNELVRVYTLCICSKRAQATALPSATSKDLRQIFKPVAGRQVQESRLSSQYQCNVWQNAEKSAFASDSDGGSLPPGKGSKIVTDGSRDDNVTPSNAILRILFHASWLLCLSAQPASAAFRKRGKWKRRQEIPNANSVLDLSWPIIKNLGFSGLVGLATGITCKAAGKTLAVLLGALFVTLQAGAYLGYVTVDWSRVHKDIIRVLDFDQNGTVEGSELKVATAKVIAVLSQGLPSGGGFCMGLALGLQR